MWIGNEVDKRNRLQPDSLNGSKVQTLSILLKLCILFLILIYSRNDVK